MKWFRNKKQITEETDKYRFDEEGDSHSLLVTDAVLRDSGMYEATAENSKGLTKIVGKLLVKCKCQLVLTRELLQSDLLCLQFQGITIIRKKLGGLNPFKKKLSVFFLA